MHHAVCAQPEGRDLVVQPLAVAAWLHIILGHFAMAPLLKELFDVDPLATDQIERQKRFLRRYAQLVMSGEAPPVDES